MPEPPPRTCATCRFWIAPPLPDPQRPVWQALNQIASAADTMRANPNSPDGPEWETIYFTANRGLNAIERPHGTCRGWAVYDNDPAPEPAGGYVHVPWTKIIPQQESERVSLLTPAGFFCENWRGRDAA